MSRATAPCARAPGGGMRVPGSHRIFTVLAIFATASAQMAGWQPYISCMQASLNPCILGLPAPEFMQMHGIFCHSASQPATSLRLANMARTVKMGWLPGARMGVSAARAQGPGPRGYYSHVQRARAPADRYFTEFGHQKCQNAVKMGNRPCTLDTILAG